MRPLTLLMDLKILRRLLLNIIIQLALRKIKNLQRHLEKHWHVIRFLPVTGFTGSGYLTSRNGHAYVAVEWEYNTDDEGEYILEFRYSLTRQKHFASHLKVNGEVVAGLIFWESTDSKTWVWDRVKVNLKKGKNTIEVNPEGMVNFDHLNVLELK